MPTYQQAKAIKDAADATYAATGRIMDAFPRAGALGLTPDSVKVTAEWRDAKRAHDAAHAALRGVNAWFLKAFKSEYYAEMRSKRAGGN